MRLSRVDRALIAGGAAALALAAAVWSVPRLIVHRASGRAQECLAAGAAGAPASCDAAESDLARIAAVPWAAHDATYRYEELRARRALAAYDHATIVAPSAVGRAQASAAVHAHQQFVEDGSGRIRLEELGAPVAAPDVGTAAIARGDRDALLLRWNHVGLWSTRVAALQAAFLEGDLAKADTIAARYAEFDPRDVDLRVAVGATLCLGPEPGRGLELLARVPADRAGERHAAIARNWGEVRAVQEACADLASVEAPVAPLERHAGVPDAIEARAVQALRLARGDVEKADAERDARELLRGEPAPSGAGLSARVPGARAALLTELLLSDPTIDARGAAELARPRAGGEPLLEPEPGDLARWLLREAHGGAPWVAPDAYVAASRKLETLAATGDDGVPEETARAVRRAAAALAIHAAAGFARGGDAEQAGAEARRAVALAPLDAKGDALVVASIAAASSDPPPGASGRADGDPVKEVEALGASRDEAGLQRARWTALTRRGQAPPDLVGWTLALARLMPEGAPGDAVETWLDAALALDGARFTLREMARARAIAARARGDAASADRWETRLAALRALLGDPRRAVIARTLGI